MVEVNISEKQIKKIRRYPPGEAPVYDATLTGRLEMSSILNPSKMTAHNFTDLRNLDQIRRVIAAKKVELSTYQGDRQALLAQLDNRKQANVNRGLIHPDDWKVPKREQERLHLLEGYADCVRVELEHLQGLLDEHSEAIADEHRAEVLKHGPMNRRQSGYRDPYHSEGRFEIVDGQHTSIIDGVPVIDDEASPYNGLAIYDYVLHVSRPWKKELNRRQKLKNEILKKARGEVMNVPEYERQYLVVRKPELPPFPKECRNFKAKPEPEQPIRVKRKKKKIKSS